MEPCSVAEDDDLLQCWPAIHLLPLPSSIRMDARPSVIKDAEYMSTVSEVLRGYADVLDGIRQKVQKSTAYFNIITQKQQIDRAALEGMVLWMQKCHLPLTTLGDGHCLFRALSWTLFGHQNAHLRLRLLSISVINEHSDYFFLYRRLLSMKEDFSLPEMIHHTSNSSPTFDNGWGNAYNIKSIALAAQRKIFVYGPVNRLDNRFRDELTLFQTLARAAHESECPHKAFYPAEGYQNSNRRSLCIMLLGERQFAHYVGILPRHWSLRESPEFAVTRRYDVSVGSRLDWGYVSSDDENNGFPRASKKRTVSLLSTPVKDPPKRTPVQKPGGRKRSMSPTEASPNPKKQCTLLSPRLVRRCCFDFSNEKESGVLDESLCGQLELSTKDLVSQDAAEDGSDIEHGDSVGRRNQIIVDHDDWDEQCGGTFVFTIAKQQWQQSQPSTVPHIRAQPSTHSSTYPPRNLFHLFHQMESGLFLTQYALGDLTQQAEEYALRDPAYPATRRLGDLGDLGSPRGTPVPADPGTVVELQGWKAVNITAQTFTTVSRTNSRECLEACRQVMGCRFVSFDLDTGVCQGFDGMESPLLVRDISHSLLAISSKAFTVKKNVDYIGDDIAVKEPSSVELYLDGLSGGVARLEVASEEMCLQLCRIHPRCNVVTFKTDNNGCFLKSKTVLNSSAIDNHAVSFVTRSASETVTTEGVTIPADTGIEVPIWYLQDDPEVWDRPYKFNSERFSPEKKPFIPPMAYLPFGAGLRICVGMRFALLEIKTLLRILQRFRIKTCPESEAELQLKTTMVSLTPGLRPSVTASGG
ncbi:putative Cytochrome P450 3A27 [Hypsibius exemplaris]|uniref:Cytochrome P450 3A27 n=1 Tax=Hypsibius exemplaris TaxID=2072580 RepID=A0A9X6RLZ0_HYPEX|nr:putative Cytochrome P450 3A27 [Hypsibius exemplaris]